MNSVREESLSFNLYRELFIYVVPGIWFVVNLFLILELAGINIPLKFLEYVSGKQDENLNLVYLIAIFFTFIVLCLVMGHAIYSIGVCLLDKFSRVNLPCVKRLNYKRDIILKIIQRDYRIRPLVYKMSDYDISLNSLPAYLILDQIGLIRNELLHMKYLERYGTLTSMNRSLSTASLLLFFIGILVIAIPHKDKNFFGIFIFIVLAFSFSVVFLYRTVRLEEEFLDRILVSVMVLDIINNFEQQRN